VYLNGLTVKSYMLRPLLVVSEPFTYGQILDRCSNIDKIRDSTFG